MTTNVIAIVYSPWFLGDEIVHDAPQLSNSNSPYSYHGFEIMAVLYCLSNQYFLKNGRIPRSLFDPIIQSFMTKTKPMALTLTVIYDQECIECI